MKYCARCLYPANHSFGIIIDHSGICSGCRVHEEKDELHWENRFLQLKAICDQYRNKTRTTHDCIIPVSGGRDSHFIVHIVKNVLGMTPILVNYNKHYNTRMGTRNLAFLRAYLGCDFIQCTVNPDRVKRITRETLKLRGSMYWHCLAGQTAFPVRTAVNYKIPLIIWGAHQGIDQVGMFSHVDEVEMTRKFRKEHDLMGLEAEDLLDQSSVLDCADLENFLYPNDKALESIGVRGLYLNNYIRWDSKIQHEQMIQQFSYETMQQQRTFDNYNDVDCFHYSGIHDYIKLIKCGYGKISDHASREIRLKRMTREEGIDLVHKYQNVRPRDLPLLLTWLNMEEPEFWSYINEHRNMDVWRKLSNGQWELAHSIINDRANPNVESARLPSIGGCQFQLNPSRDPNPIEDKYILMGRGWVDSSA